MAKTQYITLDGTNRSLRRLFRAFNKAYFGNQLDDAITVRFSRRPTRGANALYNWGDEELVVDQRFRKNGRVTCWLVLHEMNHIAVGFKAGHGPKFEKGMLRLAKAGAFNGIW